MPLSQCSAAPGLHCTCSSHLLTLFSHLAPSLQAAFEVEPAADVIALRVWPNEALAPEEARARLRTNVFSAIRHFYSANGVPEPREILDIGCSVGELAGWRLGGALAAWGGPSWASAAEWVSCIGALAACPHFGKELRPAPSSTHCSPAGRLLLCGRRVA